MSKLPTDNLIDGLQTPAALRALCKTLRNELRATTGEVERRSTHHVHRGPESLPCYCAATNDHPIGREVDAPAPQQPAITDAMVERACEAYHGPVAWRVHMPQYSTANKRADMRRALTAAAKEGKS